MMRSAMPHLGLVALVSTYWVTAADCARAAATGGVSRCLAIGRALRGGGPAYEALAGFGAVVLFTGVVTELLHRTTGDFPRGVSLWACQAAARLESGPVGAGSW